MSSGKFAELRSLFITNPSSAISESRKLIRSVSKFATYQQFFSYHLQNSHMSTCQREWSKPQMSIHCFDCGVDPQSCICLQCFLNGQHNGHYYFVFSDSTGNCDCGDSSLWNPTGFCFEHQGLKNDDKPENYIDEKLREILTDVIFKAAFSSLENLKHGNDQKVTLIFQFISSFLQFGDGFRRLIAISLTEKIDFKKMMSNISECSYQFNQMLQQLCGNLINDQLFKVNFGIVNFELLTTHSIPHMLKKLSDNRINKDDNCSIWDDFWFQSFALEPIKTIIEKYNWDWVSFILKFAELMKKFFDLKGIISINSNISTVFSDISLNLRFASQVQPNEETQNLFDLLCTTILNCGTDKNNSIVTASFIEVHPDLFYDSSFIFYIFFYHIFQCFKLKKNLKLDKLIDELDKTIDITKVFCCNHNEFGKENDLFVSKFFDKIDDLSSIQINNESIVSIPIENYFKSFHNGGSFFFSFPLFDSLSYMLKLDNMTRIKIAKLFQLGKYKRLRIQLGIVALKKLIALICSHQSIVPFNNIGLISFVEQITKNPTFVCLGIPRIFGLLQLLIGLENQDTASLNEFSIKEFFAFEMARELGIFDDFTSKEYLDENVDEKQKQMFFSFLYTSLLIVIERTLFNYNGYYFMEEQIIFALKLGKSSPNQLNDMFCAESAREGKEHLDFNTILLNVATTNKKEKTDKIERNDFTIQDVGFTLKKEIQWKPISAINSINDSKMLMTNEISKNPNSLIKINEFEDEKTYFFNSSKKVKANPEEKDNEDNLDSSGLNIRLKEFLSTPTVLTIIYNTLRSSGEKVELNDHLAMNILILISKFVNDDNQNDSSFSFDEVKEIHYDSSIIDLISKIKEILFKFKIDKDENASIENTLNQQNFRKLLYIKIGSDKLEPKSFIDILLSKGELGKIVLDQMSIEIEIDSNQTDKKSINEINKQRANKLKENIINQYKDLIDNFSMKNIYSTEESISQNNNNDDNEVCSICSSTREDQLLSYPVFIYRTKFPFIVDKPPLVTIKEGSEIPVDEDEDIHEYDDLDDELIYIEEEEEEEEEAEEEEEEEEESNFSNKRKQIMKQLMSNFISKKSTTDDKKDDDDNSKTIEVKDVQKRCTTGKNYIIQYSICPHPIHPSCVNTKTFRCPVDRSLKNGFLPCLDSVPSNLICNNKKIDEKTVLKPIKDSIICFINNFVSICNTSIEYKSILFIELIKSLSGLITTYEVRLRSLPDCLDSNKTKLLSRNLFLTIWYSYRIYGKPSIEDESIKRLSLFQKFILKLIEYDELEGINNSNRKDFFKQIFSSFMSNENSFCEVDKKRKEKEIFLFLRRVCLSDYFLLNNELDEHQGMQTKFIDWDDILSVSNLSQRYNIPIENLKGKGENEEDFEFKPIVLAKLPKEFLRFALKPFNFPVEKTYEFTVYNILDYNNLIKNYDDFNDSNNNDDDDFIPANQIKNGKRRKMNKIFKTVYARKNYPSILLMIGKLSSCILVFNNRRMTVLKPFYLDRFSCSDIGFGRGQPLFLNEERYERIMDEIISGNFSNNLFHVVNL